MGSEVDWKALASEDEFLSKRRFFPNPPRPQYQKWEMGVRALLNADVWLNL